MNFHLQNEWIVKRSCKLRLEGGALKNLKKTRKIMICFVIGFICMASSCQKKNPFVERVYSIEVQNNTNSILNYLVGYGYPDTIIPDELNNLVGINPMDYSPYDSQKEWDETFSEHNATKISFFFFSPDTLSKYVWYKVRTDYKILKRKDLSLQDLNQNNFTVTYP